VIDAESYFTVDGNELQQQSYYESEDHPTTEDVKFIRKTNILKWNTKFWKIHYMVKYGPNLKKFLLKCQAKFEFFQNGQLKKSTRQRPVISEKNQITKVNFVINLN
jgi:hypothetical protein